MRRRVVDGRWMVEGERDTRQGPQGQGREGFHIRIKSSLVSERRFMAEVYVRGLGAERKLQ